MDDAVRSTHTLPSSAALALQRARRAGQSLRRAMSDALEDTSLLYADADADAVGQARATLDEALRSLGAQLMADAELGDVDDWIEALDRGVTELDAGGRPQLLLPLEQVANRDRDLDATGGASGAAPRPRFATIYHPQHERPPLQPAPDRSRLLLERLARPLLAHSTRLDDPLAVAAEIEALCEQRREVGAWRALDKPDNWLLTSWVAARARAAQEARTALDLDPRWQERITRLIRRLSAHSRDTWPGVVIGLALDHAPRDGSWASDACALEARITARLAGGAPDGDEDSAT